MIAAPGQPPELGPLHEVDRWEWRRTSGAAAPYADLERFLDDAGLPVADLGRPTTAAARSSVAGAAVLIGGGWPVADAGSDAASPCPQVPDVAVVVLAAGGTAEPVPTPAEPFPAGEWRRTWPAAEHAAAVEAVRAAIARGDLYQANLVAHRRCPSPADAQTLATRLARVPATPWAGGIAGEGWSVHAASPELFLEVSAGVATTRPIKGTAPRGADRRADERQRDALRASVKDRAEHVMIVDLERNDLGRVAVVGGVTVDELYDVQPRAGLWHAESTVVARLRPQVGLGEVLAATFPGGSVTGAPKLAALAEIARHEPVGRGPSMGALGWIGADGRVALGLTIRTVAAAAGELHLWTGGGVTWSSDPAAEVAEAEAKAAPLLRALSR